MLCPHLFRPGTDRGTCLTLLIAVALSVAATTAAPFSLSSELVTAIGIIWLWVLAIAGKRRPVPASTPRRPFLGALPWLVLVVLAATLELYEYWQVPRGAHPTLSEFVSHLASGDARRGIAYLIWIGIGTWISLRAAGAVSLRKGPRR